MAKELDNSAILEELRENEEELHRDEKRVKIAFILGMIFILALIAGSSYFIVKSVANKSTQTLVKVTPPSISITPTPTQAVLTTPTSSPLVTNTTNDSSAADYYINLGSGTNKSTEWEDVAGTLTTADLGLYKNIKEVHLETTIDVPTANGTVSVRLFNKTDNYAVWNSERTIQAEKKGSLLISQNIIYDVGPKFYQVQMKSQLGVTANLLQARIHVVAE